MTLYAIAGCFVWLLGLCVGSFLNVVIYRLPLGLSLSKPARSFCPNCKTGIAWYDNIPVLSWLLLRARCRNCKVPISAQYPLVEAVTGLAFVLAYYLLFFANARAGVTGPSLPGDAPLLLAWLLLVAAMVACSGMDLIWYMVDTRITNWTVAAGVVFFAIWPRRTFFAERAAAPGTAALCAAFLVGGTMLLFSLWREKSPEEETREEPPPTASAAAGDKPSVSTTGGVFAITVFLALSLWLLGGIVFSGFATNMTIPGGAAWAVPLSLAALFGATVLAGAHERPADQEIHAAIEEEKPQARRTALRELLWLGPAILAGVLVYLLVAYVPAINGFWRTMVNWPETASVAPLGGAAFAIYGATVAAIAGWILRIGFTLVLGKEAFGAGDIYILAAAGATAGGDIALLGLLFSIGLAMVGWLLGLLLKSSTLIPFGPWLALGFLMALWLNRPAAALLHGYYDDLQIAWAQRPDMVAMLGGVLLIGTGVAVFLARLLRRLIEPRE